MMQVIQAHIKTIIAIAAIGVFLFFITIGSCDKENLLAAASLTSEADEALSGGSATVFDQTVNAFALPVPGLSPEDELLFFVGNSFFNQNWVQAPSSTTARDGLGPYFNAKSCSGCHFKDGRGEPPATIGQLSEGLIVRLSIPGNGAHGEPVPDPMYGGQFQDHAIDGVAYEGQYEIVYVEVPGYYPDGTSYSLRKPQINFLDLQYGAMSSDIMYSARVAPQMCGLGLLEAISEKDILAHADPDDRNGDGISGRANYVWNAIENKEQIGRFGWKANQPTILQQVSGAFNGDIGITSPYFKDQHITDAQSAQRKLVNGGDPEIDNDDLEKVHLYSATLAVPARRNVDDQDVLSGKQLFIKLGCNACHLDKVVTGNHPKFSVLSNQTIHPYTDLLLHDMGEGLADGRPDFQASGSEWRTPPLWGIGLFKTVNKHTYYLHDGRARSIEEAILWHGGEASTAKASFMQLSKAERDQLLLFLESL
ncbi:MAG TPA: di-heme oxidoredictase family protein [Chitinophagales bacterium]|nr:di-heme oxidoredictase family protein [Chitinophagales bacterium]